jgi:isopenicillin N synthase-like dioxygenase
MEEGHRAVPELFDLPTPIKEKCNMINSPSFLGYTSLGAETTASRTDLREVCKYPFTLMFSQLIYATQQFDFGTPINNTWREGDPFWQRIEGPSQVSLS